MGQSATILYSGHSHQNQRAIRAGVYAVEDGADFHVGYRWKPDRGDIIAAHGDHVGLKIANGMDLGSQVLRQIRVLRSASQPLSRHLMNRWVIMKSQEPLNS